MPITQTFDHGLNAKIPGQSLTMTPRSLPMENPPLLTDPRQAAQYFWDKIHQPKQLVKLIVLLRKGVPCEYIARTILYTAIIHGIIHINTALLVAKILTKQLAAIGHRKGVKVKVRNPDLEFANFVTQNKADMYDAPATKEPEGPISKGLLAKGKK